MTKLHFLELQRSECFHTAVSKYSVKQTHKHSNNLQHAAAGLGISTQVCQHPISQNIPHSE